MAAAAEAVSAVEGTCLGVTDDLGTVDPTDEALVCTVGSMRVHPNQVCVLFASLCVCVCVHVLCMHTCVSHRRLQQPLH